MQDYVLRSITVVNEGNEFVADVLIKNGLIHKIDKQHITVSGAITEINGSGKYLLPGVIDDQVHFREPGLTYKATIASESRAAVAGGVTSFMDMPNTIPNTLTRTLLEQKYQIAGNTSVANYSFYMGVSNDNIDEVLSINAYKNDVCGIKIFMGSSTGNMLVDNYVTLNTIFENSEMLIATHCEDEKIIAHNYQTLKEVKENLEPADHPVIRNTEACFESSLAAVELAKRHDARLHILHISTAKELQLFGNMLPLAQKRITAEACVHHLHFTSNNYDELGYKIKCNPAIKEPLNKQFLWDAVLNDTIDVIATDHAPHLLSEKQPPYEKAHAGLPLVQHPLLLMLYYHSLGKISLTHIAKKMSHDVAVCFQIKNRGFIREGCAADLVMVDLNKSTTITPQNILYKCGWTPLENMTIPATIEKTFVNGNLVYENNVVNTSYIGERLAFNR